MLVAILKCFEDLLHDILHLGWVHFAFAEVFETFVLVFVHNQGHFAFDFHL